MRIPRVFISGDICVDNIYTLENDAAHHLINVLRIKQDQPIVLFNGDGNEYSAIVNEVQKRKLIVNVDAKLALTVESRFPIHLGQGIAKGDRMETVLQKATELGVTEVTPIITERCNVKLSAERWAKKSAQWEKIIIGACEQSGRNVLPILHPPITLSQWCKQSTEQYRITFDPHAQQHLQALPVNQHGVRILIGPEGGLSEAETYAAEQTGFNTVKIGPRVLRTETAAIASIAIIQAQYGDLTL